MTIDRMFTWSLESDDASRALVVVWRSYGGDFVSVSYLAADETNNGPEWLAEVIEGDGRAETGCVNFDTCPVAIPEGSIADLNLWVEENIGRLFVDSLRDESYDLTEDDEPELAANLRRLADLVES